MKNGAIIPITDGKGGDKEMCERVRLADAAKELGCSQQAVREHMKLGIWDLGEVISPKKSKKKQYSYYIYRAKLDRILGKVNVDGKGGENDGGRQS